MKGVLFIFFFIYFFKVSGYMKMCYAFVVRRKDPIDFKKFFNWGGC